MKIGWIYPHREKCGIAIYSRAYIETSPLHESAVSIDPQWWIKDRVKFMETAGACDMLHVQYDTASFMHEGRDFYRKMIRMFKKPVVVSLHEVYREDPFAYPRSALSGVWPVKMMRRLIYDWRHPVQCAFERHVKNRFYAQHLLVHHLYHIKILSVKGIDPLMVSVVPLPVRRTKMTDAFSFPQLPQVRFGAIGFLNPAYDYDLLFSVLENCKRSWTFTWIGGTRAGSDDSVYRMINDRIEQNGWIDRFSITGWISEEDLVKKLDEIDIVLALFATRSSSSSLATAMGALKPVCANSMPLTDEVAAYLGEKRGGSGGSPILIADANPLSVVETIEKFLANGGMQQKLFTNLVEYTANVSYEKSAAQLMNIYQKMCKT